MSRLVDIEDVKAFINGLDSLPWEEEVGELVASIPTAYNVEKVVAELEELKAKYERLRAVCEDKFEANELHTRCLQIDKDIDVVRKGGSATP